MSTCSSPGAQRPRTDTSGSVRRGDRVEVEVSSLQNTPYYQQQHQHQQHERGTAVGATLPPIAGPAATAVLVASATTEVWAIGTGLTATPADAQGVHAHVRSLLADKYGDAVTNACRIQYGGSVRPETVDELMACPDIDGALVGGASLVPDKFARIVGFKAAVSA